MNEETPTPAPAPANPWSRPLLYLSQNKITLAGVVLTTSAALTMIGFWALEVLQLRPSHPYAGLVGFVLLPAFFVGGLILMPLGMLMRRRALKKAGELPTTYPRVDFKEGAVRRALSFVATATMVNIALFSTASYKAVEYMDSTQFCGLTCHSVMSPEYGAFLNSPHSRVGCAHCHVGPGATGFVRAKLSGTRQLIALTLGNFSKPVPSPVHNLRPSRETCEQCHWPQKFTADKLVVRHKFAEDEANTKSTTVLVLKLGGVRPDGGTGIHGRHLGDTASISYVSIDDRRQLIPQVSTTTKSGQVTEYTSAEVKATPEQLAKGERRTMDCIDCHNRPTHAFELPERALDKALADGRISPELPFIKKKAVELLKAEYPSQEAAAEKITAGITEYYKKDQPTAYNNHRALVEAAAQQAAAIYKRNVYPSLNLKWGTHPNNIGHEDFQGCFRCHDDNHKARDGKAITQDCNACHTVLAMDESNPKILEDLGVK